MGWTTLDGYVVVHATERAVCIKSLEETRHNKDGTWLPRSMLQDGDNIHIGDMDLTVKSWIAEKEGLA